jgi:protein involved in polysaccharide export with SLBB domain
MKYHFSLITIFFLSISAAIGQNYVLQELQEKFGGRASMINDMQGHNKNKFNYHNPSFSNSDVSPFFSNTGMDQQLDQDKYLIGTGDGFSIYLWGAIDKQIISVVNIEGELIIPDVGAIKIKGKTLREAKKIIRDKIQDYYKKADMTIVLDNIRKFKVYILGEIKEPGAYYVNGSTRVSDLIHLAGGTNPGGSMRNISIINSIDSSTNYADIALFYNCNNIDKNPYLNEGDRVFIPKSKEIIMINGAVNYPGKYDILEDDSLFSILRLAGGLSRGADSSRILVKRFKNNIDSLATLVCSFKDSSVFNFKLQPDDRIIVFHIPDYRVYRSVLVTGEVQYPGEYPIMKNMTTLGNLIELAGGFTKDANLKGSTIIRKLSPKTGELEFERLKRTPHEFLSPLEKNFLFSKIGNQDSIVSIDIESLGQGDYVNNFILRDGDKINIAANTFTVKILGGVVNPGLVEYKNGEPYSYYIDKANGFSNRARKHHIKIMKNGTENWRDLDKTHSIEPGDLIWVPEKQYKNGLSVTRDMIMLLGSIATVIISALTIRDFVK